MKKLESMNKLFMEIFKSYNNFIVFPFAIVGIVSIIVFYVFFPFYMLSDLLVKELNSIIQEDKEKDSSGVQIVKNLIGFGIVVLFNFYRALMSIVLAIGYFMTSISFMVSSLGKVKSNPFEFSV